MSELEMSRAIAHRFGRIAVEKADNVPAGGKALTTFRKNKAVQAIRLYKQGEPWEPGEREVVIDGATKGVLEAVLERLEG